MPNHCSAQPRRRPHPGWPGLIFLSAIVIACATPALASTPDRILLMLDDADAIHLTNLADTDTANGASTKRRRYQVIVEAASSPTETEAGPSGKAATQRPLLPSPAIQKIVRQAAQKHQVEAALIYAVMGSESAFNAHAVSNKGALGLMQLMPGTAARYGVTDALDAQQNIAAGAWHLRTLLDEFGGNKNLALAAYNAGSAAVTRHQNQIPAYRETQAYVPIVLGRYAALRRASPDLRVTLP